MLPYEQFVSSFISTISEAEMKLELLRNVLVELENFNIANAWNFFDHSLKGYISSSDIIRFLQKKRIRISDQESMAIISRYNTTSCPNLSFNDFIYMILPNNEAIRIRELKKISNIDDSGKTIFRNEVEYALARLFTEEILLTHQLSVIKSKYPGSLWRFDPREAFNSIEDENSGFITINSINKFFDPFGISLPLNKLQGFIRNINKRSKDKLTISQLVERYISTYPIEESTLCIKTYLLNNKHLSSRKNHYSPYYTHYLKSASPIRKHIESAKEKRIYFSNFANQVVKDDFDTNNSIFNIFNVSNLYNKISFTPKNSKVFSENNLKCTPLKQINRSRVINSNNFQNIKFANKDDITELKYFIQKLGDQIKFEKEVEKSRKSLFLSNDFSVKNLFKSFDTKSQGYLRCSEFIKGFQNFSVNLEKKSLFLIFNRYNSGVDQNVLIFSFKHFEKLFQELDKSIFSILNLYDFSHSLTNFEQISELSPTTRLKIQELFNSIINCELSFEAIRQSLHKRPFFDIFKMFKKCDTFGKGFISKKSLFSILTSFCEEINERESNYLFDRFDKNKDNMISYFEFIDELTPKLLIHHF